MANSTPAPSALSSTSSMAPLTTLLYHALLYSMKGGPHIIIIIFFTSSSSTTTAWLLSRWLTSMRIRNTYQQHPGTPQHAECSTHRCTLHCSPNIPLNSTLLKPTPRPSMRALDTITYPMLRTHPDFAYVIATTLGHTDADQASNAQLCLHAQVYTD
jgi:hypothetical protein